MSKWDKAIRYNKHQRYPDATVRRLQAEVLTGVDGEWGPKTCAALAAWQDGHGLYPDGKAGPATRRVLGVQWAEQRVLTDLGVLELARPTIQHESGGRDDAANRDGEFEGRFDTDERIHWASKHQPDGGTHVGLSLGRIQVTQDGGNLGLWLKLMWVQGRATVEEHLGERASHIVELTNRGGRSRRVVSGEGPGKRSARVRPVDGADLWEDPWVDRLRALARTELAARTLERVAIEVYMRPQLELATELKVQDAATLAVIFDIAVQYGGGGCRRRMREAERGGRLDVTDLINTLPEARRPRRRRVYNRSPWWVTFVGGLEL
jgi:hypothetical protein